jgi:hypothetical protein
MLRTSMLAASVRPFSVVGILFLCFYVHDYCVEIIVLMYSMYVVYYFGCGAVCFIFVINNQFCTIESNRVSVSYCF